MPNPAMQGRTSTVDLADVRADLQDGTPLPQVAAAHGVSPDTLKSRLNQHGYTVDGKPKSDNARPRIGSRKDGHCGAYIGGGDRPVVTRPWGSFVRGGEVG